MTLVRTQKITYGTRLDMVTTQEVQLTNPVVGATTKRMQTRFSMSASWRWKLSSMAVRIGIRKLNVSQPRDNAPVVLFGGSMPVACSTSALTGQDGSLYYTPSATKWCLLDFTDFPAGTSITVPSQHDSVSATLWSSQKKAAIYVMSSVKPRSITLLPKQRIRFLFQPLRWHCHYFDSVRWCHRG